MNKNDKSFIAQKIRTQYTETAGKPAGDLEKLKLLDAKVRRPANIFAYTFGSISAIIMGAGMSLTMTDIGAALGSPLSMIVGISAGLVGMALALVNYPIYKKLLGSRRKKYAEEIIKLSDNIITND